MSHDINLNQAEATPQARQLDHRDATREGSAHPATQWQPPRVALAQHAGTILVAACGPRVEIVPSESSPERQFARSQWAGLGSCPLAPREAIPRRQDKPNPAFVYCEPLRILHIAHWDTFSGTLVPVPCNASAPEQDKSEPKPFLFDWAGGSCSLARAIAPAGLECTSLPAE